MIKIYKNNQQIFISIFINLNQILILLSN